MVNYVEQSIAEDEAQPVYNASDEKQVNNARKEASRKKRDRLNFIQEVMNIKEGRRWVKEELDSCHIFDNVFYTDTHKTAFALGERNRGIKLLSDVMASSPDMYVTMMKENK